MLRFTRMVPAVVLASMLAVVPSAGLIAKDNQQAKKVAAEVKRAGFYTEMVDGRLWVFREGSEDLKSFKEGGEPAKSITRVGAGPNGVTVRAVDAETLDAYLSAL